MISKLQWKQNYKYIISNKVSHVSTLVHAITIHHRYILDHIASISMLSANTQGAFVPSNGSAELVIDTEDARAFESGSKTGM